MIKSYQIYPLKTNGTLRCAKTLLVKPVFMAFHISIEKLSNTARTVLSLITL